MAAAELKQRLGGGKLACVDKLDAADVERYSTLLDAASQQQLQLLQQASEEALKHVPALLRGTVRKLLF